MAYVSNLATVSRYNQGAGLTVTDIIKRAREGGVGQAVLAERLAPVQTGAAAPAVPFSALVATPGQLERHTGAVPPVTNSRPVRWKLPAAPASTAACSAGSDE